MISNKIDSSGDISRDMHGVSGKAICTCPLRVERQHENAISLSSITTERSAMYCPCSLITMWHEFMQTVPIHASIEAT